MKSKEGFMKIKVKHYNTIISKEISEDSNMKELMLAIKDIVLAMGYAESIVNEYITLN